MQNYYEGNDDYSIQSASQGSISQLSYSQFSQSQSYGTSQQQYDNTSNDNASLEYGENQGYYDEWGQWIESYTAPPPIIDEDGRVLDPSKIKEEDPYEVEDLELFLSQWQTPRTSSLKSAVHASKCVWPEEKEIVTLKRLDVYETSTPNLSQLMSAERRESLRIRQDTNYSLKMSLFFTNQPNSAHTKEVVIESAVAPKRNRLRPIDKRNARDLTPWTARESLHSFCAGLNILGSTEYFVDWEDAPDRYCVTRTEDPRGGWRRLYRFSAYPITQYFLISREVDHEILKSEGGKGQTYVLERGNSVYAYKHWRLALSFYGFDLQLPSANKYTVYEAYEPFLRMMISMGPISHTEEWTEKFSFYAFDVPVAGTVPLQLQHCIRSIHTTAAGVNRHRLTAEDPILPWQFRFTIFVYPATLEECSVDTQYASHATDPGGGSIDAQYSGSVTTGSL